MSGNDPRLNLLLASADERAPVLADGLPGDASQSAPQPPKVGKRRDSFGRRLMDKGPGDLKAQRWGVLAPEGADGDRILEAIEPLLRLREAEQGAPITRYRVPCDMDVQGCLAFRDKVYWADDVPEAERPYYLALLGDLDQIPLELQQILSGTTLIGRLAFTDTEGRPNLSAYESYASKVARLARGNGEITGDLLFHVAADGTRATAEADAGLVTPSFEAATSSASRGQLPATQVRRLEVESTSALLTETIAPRPSVLLTVSHGVGAPRGGWRSPERMRREQGSLVLGEGEVMDAERISGESFLPGGLWFCLACFGAGTPQKSAYHTWLSLLSEQRAYRGRLDSVLASLPFPGQSPFVAALPQAALASPNGPLAVIGHVDLAWTYAFTAANDPSDTKRARILSSLEILMRGGRAGVAMKPLTDAYGQLNEDLTIAYQEEETARHSGQPHAVDLRERGHLWMARNDLRGYVLLGDPAVKLPLPTAQAEARPKTPPTLEISLSPPAAHPPSPAAVADTASSPPAAHPPSPAAGLDTASPPPAAHPPSPAAVADTAPASDDVPVASKVAAVHALLRGDETPRTIAVRAGVTLDELWSWFDSYRQAGHKALSGQ